MAMLPSLLSRPLLPFDGHYKASPIHGQLQRGYAVQTSARGELRGEPLEARPP